MIDPSSSVNQTGSAHNDPNISHAKKTGKDWSNYSSDKTKVSNMSDLAKKSPEGIEKIHQAIAMSICRQMKKRGDESRKKLKEIRNQ